MNGCKCEINVNVIADNKRHFTETTDFVDSCETGVLNGRRLRLGKATMHSHE